MSWWQVTKQYQWYSSKTQPMLGHSMGTLCLWKFQHKLRNKLRGLGDAPQKIFGFFWASQVSSEAISGHTVTLNQEHSYYARFVHGVKLLRVITNCTRFLRIQIVRLRPLCTFSTWSQSTMALSVLIICKRACSWWGTTSSCWDMYPSVPQPGYATEQHTSKTICPYTNHSNSCKITKR